MLDKILTYVIAGAICAAFIAVIYVLAKKQMALKEELLKTLTEEQKKELEDASLNNSSLKKGDYIQISLNENGAKVIF